MFLQKQHAGLAGVVRGQLIICLVNGTLTGIGLFILDIKFALTLSLVATVCSIIPIFGVIISSIPIVLMAITDSFVTGLFALGWILIIHFIEGNILNPKIIGKSAEIHPVLVIGHFYGILEMARPMWPKIPTNTSMKIPDFTT